ncbi:helix-turn-helix domain-containing protein [Candidatus Parcubacteria bacterium]|nr:helix-turn-helix domain-containing protein [Candidatus Parcubacteria bacterium]
MNYIAKLQNIGFSEEEAKIYLAGLRLGTAKVSEIAKETEIPRTSVYNYLKKLIENGSFRKIKKQSIEYFIASNPKDIFASKKEKMESFSNILPMLENLIDFQEKKSYVEFSDVKKGLFDINEMMLKTSNKKYFVCAIESGATNEAMLKIVGWKFIQQMQKKIHNTKVPVQSILLDDTIPFLKVMPKETQKIFAQRLPLLHFLNKEKFPFEINLFLIYPYYIFIVVPQNVFTIKIENKYIYRSLKTMFIALYNKTYSMDTKKLLELEK